MDVDQLVAVQAEFQQFLQDLTSVEKRTIHALTDVARDVLRTRPQGAQVVAAVIISRVLQAPVSLKLPTLYLLDSIVKLVGEPYTSYFGAQLPDAFAATWLAGNGNLHKSLQKLFTTWAGVFPQHVLDSIAARLAQLPASGMPPQYTAAAVPSTAAPLYYQPGQQAMPAAEPPQLYGYAAQQPLQQLLQPDVAGYGLPQEVLQQPIFLQQQPLPPPSYAVPQQDFALSQPVYAQQLQQQPAALQRPQPAAAAQQPVNVADLMASLVHSGILAAPAQGGALQLPAGSGTLGESTPPAATTPLRPEGPVSLEFTPERIKDKNPAGVRRLLEITERTKGQFLDRKFLRRQRRTGTMRISRLWYVDLDTWMASTVGAGTLQAAQQQQDAAAVAAATPPEQFTVPVDDSQTHCALSGERFQQFWDEQHQEWRYRDAKRLDAEEAARYGLEEGAIVLVSALGAPTNGNLLQPAAGVLSTMAAEQEIAADLAAAAAAEGGEAAGEGSGAQDVKPGLKHERNEADAAIVDQALEQKRLRVH